MKEFKGYKKGVNFGGWFSQCDHSEIRYDTFIVENDIRTVSEWGFDHVRIPVDYELLQNLDGSFKEDGFDRLYRAVSLCHKYDLNVIIDLHKTIGFSFDSNENEAGFFDSEKYQEYFCSLWEKIAKIYGNDDRVAFELLNEVTDSVYADSWNNVAGKAVERIRKYAPSTKILFGGCNNNSVSQIKNLAMPFDENTVYNFHCYNPLIFTHQGAYWIDSMDQNFRMKFDTKMSDYQEYSEKYIGYPMEEQLNDSDAIIDVDYFENLFAEAIEIAEARNVALYCGEYGVIDLADPKDALKWYRCIHEVFEKHNIGRAVWSYKEMDFGIVDKHYDEVRKELLELL